MSLSQFQYEPLQAGEIRILDLLPDASSKMRHLTLKTHFRRSKYVALSYTWGASTETFTFSCNGQNLPVRENLLVALSHLRGIVDMPIWVDAMCINQSDDIEKIVQIQLMTEIYRGAEKVLVSRGQGTDYNAGVLMYKSDLAWRRDPRSPTCHP